MTLSIHGSKHSDKSNVSLSDPCIGHEICCFDLLTKAEWQKYRKLGQVLDTQILKVNKRSCSTQTQWRWRVMAERWKHARVIYARPPQHESEVNSDSSQTEESETWGGESRDFVVYRGSNSEEEDDIIGACRSDDDMDVDHLQTIKEDDDDEFLMKSGTTFEETLQEGKTTKEKVEEKQFNALEDKIWQRMSKTSQAKFMEKAHEIFIVRKTRTFDKIVDTSDLEFDPYNQTMYITRLGLTLAPQTPPVESKGDGRRKLSWDRKTVLFNPNTPTPLFQESGGFTPNTPIITIDTDSDDFLN